MLPSDDFLDTVEVGSFVEVNLSNYDKIPVTEKVLQINLFINFTTNDRNLRA